MLEVKNKMTVRVATIDYIQFDDFEFPLDELASILEALEETSYGMQHILIDNKKIETELEKRGVFSKSARGSGSRGQNFEEFYKEVQVLQDRPSGMGVFWSTKVDRDDSKPLTVRVQNGKCEVV